MKKLLLLVIAGGLFLAAVWYFFIYNSEKRQIRKLIDTMAVLPVKAKGSSPESGILKLAKVDEIFVEPLTAQSSRSDFNRTFSHEEIRSMLMFLRRKASQVALNIANVEIFVAGAGVATFNFEAELVLGHGSDKITEVLLVAGSAEKKNGKWRIKSILAESAVQK